MPRSVGLILVLVTILVAPSVVADIDAAQYEKAIKAIRCDCGCPPQAVKDCTFGRAAQVQRDIHDQMAGDPVTGQTDMTAEALIASYVERQGDQILIAPAARGFNLVAWLGPLAGLLFASGGVALLIVRWNRQQRGAVLPVAPALSPDDPYLRRLNEELEELE